MISPQCVVKDKDGGKDGGKVRDKGGDKDGSKDGGKIRDKGGDKDRGKDRGKDGGINGGINGGKNLKSGTQVRIVDTFCIRHFGKQVWHHYAPLYCFYCRKTAEMHIVFLYATIVVEKSVNN